LASTDPQVRRQAMAIAESLLEEVTLMPFTFCDADDPNVATASSAAGCANAEALGPEAGETRYTSPQFDHVNDYNGFTMTGIRDISNTTVTELAAYSASVAVSAAALDDISAVSGDALAITVTVDGPGGVQVKLQGFRTRHSPNAAL
jgi:MSHA pilin protein MshD